MAEQTDQHPPQVQLHQQQQQLDQLWEQMAQADTAATFCPLLKEYCVAIVASGDSDLFLSYFVEKHLLRLLRQKVGQWAREGQMVRTTFSVLQFLMKGLKGEQELFYLLARVNQEQFISEEYLFEEEQDQAYYANFLKVLVRQVNQDHRFLSVFLNIRQPHFPLLLQLLRMHNCSDSIMQTSSKLAVLETSNNPHPLLQTYLCNFPFVLFYPLHLQQMEAALKQANENHCPIGAEALENSIKYMEDFVQVKERYVIDMYTNAFMRVVGRYLYVELTHLTGNNSNKGVQLLKVLLSHLLPELTVVKVRIALFCLLATCIPSRMKACLETRTYQLEEKHWLPEACSEEVSRHCRAVFYRGEHSEKSLIRRINSFIPRSKDNWLYHEVSKVSNIIGYEVVLQQPLDIDSPQPDSFLHALQVMIDEPHLSNEVFSCIQSTKDEELMYFYLLVLTQLCDCGDLEDKLDFGMLVPSLTSCTSLCLVQAFHSLVCRSKIKGIQSDLVDEAYHKVTQKLVHFVMTKGWRELQLRARTSRSSDYDSHFSADIYREIECELLLFVSLRILLGTDNAECSPFNPQKWEHYPQITCETILKCRDANRQGAILQAILDGQFLNFKDAQEMLVNKQELLLTDLQFYQDGGNLEITGGPTNANFCASISLDDDLRRYLLKEATQRREMADRIALELKQLCFELEYPYPI